MRALLITTAAAGAALLATPSTAQEAADFSGFRLEALGGYDHLSGGGEDGDGKSGFAYGVAGGYDAAVGRARIGAEVEITDSTVRQRATSSRGAFRSDMGRDLYLGVRAGYVLSPAAMIYAKAGYTNARLTSSFTIGGATTREAVNLDGFRAGAGMEVKIAPRIYVKGEYRYSHYGDQNGVEVDADRHQLMAGVGVRF